MGQRQVHTLSTYAPSSAGINLGGFSTEQKSRIISYISMLRDKEAAFYQEFFPGCNNFTDFKAKLTSVLNNISSQDAQAIRNFTADRVGGWLYSSYEKNSKTLLTDEATTTITFKLVGGDEAEEQLRNAIEQELQSLVGTGSNNIVVTSVTINGDSRLAVNLGLDTASLKAVTNAALGTKLQPDTNSLDQFKSVILKSDKIISLTSGNESFVYKADSLISGSPFNHSKKEIDKMSQVQRKNSKWNQLEQRLKTDIQRHLGFSNTSPEFQKAFNMVWDTQIANAAKGQDNYFGIAGLTYGGSVQNIIGALGEIQVALLGYYLKMICGVEITSKFRSLISNPFINGEQLKADVVIAGAGVQVKNYGASAGQVNSKQRLNVNVHFDRLKASPIGSTVSGFEEFLVNHFFNKSVGGVAPLGDIIEALKLCFAELASMDIGQSFDDKVTFYFLSGSYFLPASELLNMLYIEQTIEVENVSITSAYEGMTDVGYHSPSSHPTFLKWYKYPKGQNSGRLTPQDPAFDDYTKIYNSISFRASIIYSSLLNVNFKIF